MTELNHNPVLRRTIHVMTMTLAGYMVLHPAHAAEQTATAAPRAGAAAAGLEEIVVSAQRVEQNQQDVPISITTLTATDVERHGASGTETLSTAVPSLQFSRQNGNGGAPYLRGVGSAQAAAGSSSPVAIYVDDVYYGAPTASLLQFNNIAQVEVLKGPQGTLFGRNATGGVVHVRTRHPTQEPRFDASVGYGNFQTTSGSLYANAPVSQSWAVNLAAMFSDQDEGYGSDFNTGDDVYKTSTYGVRMQARWDAGSATKLLLSADYARTNSDAGLNSIILPGTISISGLGYTGPYSTGNVPADRNISHQYGFSGRLDHDFGAVRLASISAYRYSNLEPYTNDNDGDVPLRGYAYVITPTRAYSQELQLLSPAAAKLQWMVGAYYYDELAKYDPPFIFQTGATTGFQVLSRQAQRSYAAFADGNYPLFESTRLTLGVRYTEDRFREKAAVTNLAGTVYFPPTPFATRSDFSKVTYRGILDHHFTEDVMAYASYSRGFKSGGYNLSSPIAFGAIGPVVRPEVLDAYEVGFKSELFDRTLRLNAAVFHYDYSDLQVAQIQVGTSVVTNAAKARIRGADLDITVAPLRGLSISAGLALLFDAQYVDFPGATFATQKTTVNQGFTNLAPCPVGTDFQAGTPVPGMYRCTFNAAGNDVGRAPEFTASLSSTYSIPTPLGDISLTGSYYHNSGYFWEPDNVLRQPKYDLVNAQLGWLSVEGTYELSLWGKNLTDEYYYSFMSSNGFSLRGVPEAPRTYGVTVGVHF